MAIERKKGYDWIEEQANKMVSGPGGIRTHDLLVKSQPL